MAEINLAAFKGNIQAARRLLKPGVKLMAVVKADAYGHGAVPIARAAVEAGVDCLGVGILDEGIQLRENGVEAPIHVLAGIFTDELDDLIRSGLSTTVFSLRMAEDLAQRAENLKSQVGVHLKVDTGMGRLGVSPEQLPTLVERVHQLKSLRLESVFTHLATADDPDPEYTRLQLSRLEESIQRLDQAGLKPPRVHAANSAALLQFPESQYSLVRAGILLYGALPSPHLVSERDRLNQMEGPPLRPVMSWKTRILQINQLPRDSYLSYGKNCKVSRDSKIATLPVGYADGLLRCLSGKMEVLIHGKRVPQVGTICMDLCLVDVTDIPEAREGDSVLLFGRENEVEIPVEEMAELAGTISYEILCRVGKRVPRVYLP